MSFGASFQPTWITAPEVPRLGPRSPGSVEAGTRTKGKMMANLQTFRARVPIVARMVEKAFNGDMDEDDEGIDFILIASKREGSNRVTATLANFSDTQEILSKLVEVLAESKTGFQQVDDDVAGHA